MVVVMEWNGEGVCTCTEKKEKMKKADVSFGAKI